MPHTIQRPEQASPLPHEPRVSLSSDLMRLGPLDGGWWPRSRDASTELAELAAALIGPLGGVARLTVDARDWENLPRRSVTADGRATRVGYFPELDHMIFVTRGHQDTFMLLVVPPDTEPQAAATALKEAAAGADGHSARQILGDAETAATNTIAAITIATSDRRAAESADISRWLDDGAPARDAAMAASGSGARDRR